MDSYLLDLAILPGIALLIYIYNKDKVEKEPISLLLLLLFGGLLSCVTSYFLEIAFENFFIQFVEPGTIVYAFIEAFAIAALVEEGSKYYFLNRFSWRSKNFNCTFDGLIYAVFVSLGFAIGENILYVLEMGLDTAIARAFTSIPGHMAFSIVMGLFYAKAKVAEKSGERIDAMVLRFAGLILAITLHGFYDFLLMAEIDALYYIWMILMAGIYIFAFVSIHISSKKDRYI